jgi:hypothetical protein
MKLRESRISEAFDKVRTAIEIAADPRRLTPEEYDDLLIRLREEISLRMELREGEQKNEEGG